MDMLAAFNLVKGILNLAPLVLSGVEEGAALVTDLVDKAEGGELTERDWEKVHADIARKTSHILRPLERNT